jgi:glutathione peroxidase
MPGALLAKLPLALDGTPFDPARFSARAILVVNVASRCGLTKQYDGLQQLAERFADQGLTVLGVPCNQFGEQEPGSPDEIAEFCSTSYAVTFPLTEKVAVNGQGRHPLFEELCELAGDDGHSGDIRWNFEKFLVDRRGVPVRRFAPTVSPDDPELVQSIEAALGDGDAERWESIPAAQVEPGDYVRLASGAELEVTRIIDRFLGRAGMLCLVEDTASRWLARPVPVDGAVERLHV